MNKLYYGDNLTVLKGCISDESVDLIYLDPPFNSQATYNVLFKSTAGENSHAQIEAFEDTWHWGDEAELAFDGVMTSGNSDAAEMLRAMRAFLKENDMMAYLVHDGGSPSGAASRAEADRQHVPALRPDRKPLSETPDGCDFWAANFRTEIIWKRTSIHSDCIAGDADRRYDLLLLRKGDSFHLEPRVYHYTPDGKHIVTKYKPDAS